MTVDDTPGTVTIYRRGRTGLYADDHGVTVRNYWSRVRRVTWPEISCFADGSRMNEGSYFWVLHIVLHTGRKVTVMAGPPTPETLAAIRHASRALACWFVALDVRVCRGVRTQCTQTLEGPKFLLKLDEAANGPASRGQ